MLELALLELALLELDGPALVELEVERPVDAAVDREPD